MYNVSVHVFDINDTEESKQDMKTYQNFYIYFNQLTNTYSKQTKNMSLFLSTIAVLL